MCIYELAQTSTDTPRKASLIPTKLPAARLLRAFRAHRIRGVQSHGRDLLMDSERFFTGLDTKFRRLSDRKLLLCLQARGAKLQSIDGDRITREYHNHGQLLEPLTRQHLVSLTQLLAGASALLVTAASAAPLSPNASVVPESNIQNVRRVCSESGHCWRERGERRIIIREHHDSYGYAPRRERYIKRGGYRGRHRHPRAGC
jgi:hypothetical protein